MSVVSWLERLNPMNWRDLQGGDDQPGAISVDPTTGQRHALDLDPQTASGYEKAALLSMDVFNDQGAPEGFTGVSEADLLELGVNPSDFSVDEIGFDAALYRDDLTGQFTLAFRGSEAGSWSNIREDWFMTNAGQVVGSDVPAAYEQARALTSAAKAALGDDLCITGHSMGGGLANYAAVANDLDFTIFNAVGLSDVTIAALGDKLDAYTGQGTVINDRYDPLTNIGGRCNDETWGGKHVGHSALFFVDNEQFNGRAWLMNLLDPGRRAQAHEVGTNIAKFLRFESERFV